MSAETTTPAPDPNIPPPPSDGTAAMLDLVKNLQAGMQQLQTKMQEDSKALVEKCKMVSPLGGDFRAFNEVGYVLQYLRSDSGLRRKVVDFVKSEVEAAARSASNAAAANATLAAASAGAGK